MSVLEIVRINLLSPMVLAFALGIIAARLKSDLRLPDQIYQFLALILLLAIGLKGGVGLAKSDLGSVLLPALATVMLGAIIPVWCYAILRRLGKFDAVNAGAIAAHYGSVSAVTFSAAVAFLDQIGQPYEGFMPTLVALLEIPGILVALALARRGSTGGGTLGEAMREVLTGKSLLLLIGGVVIGFLSGPVGYEQVAPLFVGLFPGLLTLFLLEMGVVVGSELGALKRVGVFLLAFGMLMPVFNGFIGVVVGSWVGLSLGGSMILGVIVASASYIAAPAAVRVALPDADPGLYLIAAIAITFPFNLVIGLPLYFQFAQLIHG